MSSAAERRAKIEKLKKDREIKELERKQREAEAAQAKQNMTASNDLISKILSSKLEAKQASAAAQDGSANTAGGPESESTPAHNIVQIEKVPLKVSSYVVEIEIQPKRKPETYDRDAQCEILDGKSKLGTIGEEEEDEDDFEDRFGMMAASLRQSGVGDGKNLSRRSSTVIPTGVVMKEKRIGATGNKLCPKCQAVEVSNDFKQLNKEEAKEVMKQKDFEDFIGNSSRLIERALGQEFNLAGNFFDDDEKDKEDDKKVVKGGKLTKKFVFQEKDILNRAVTSIDWSPNQPELFLASFSKSNEWSMDELDGYINLYSLSLQSKPELTLTCQYEVTKAMFNPHDPNIVIGATQTGYLLEWDIRANKKPINTGFDRHNRSQPIQKSCLALNGHNHPVYSLNVIGSQNAHSIVSVSNDGKMCMWKPKMLADSREYARLEIPQNLQPKKNQSEILAATNSSIANKQNVSAHCMDIAEGENNKFFVGAEDFNIYQCNIHSDTNSHVDLVLSGHHAPVTGLNVHPGLSQSEKYSEMSDLMLSSSMDWTVKLWHPKERTTPLFTFESSQEYVYDVQWSPSHPAVFASVDAEGYVDVWDINRDKDAPIIRRQISDKPRPLNCCRWSRDGRRLVVGDADGYLTMLQVDSDLHQPKNDDFEKVVNLIQYGK